MRKSLILTLAFVGLGVLISLPFVGVNAAQIWNKGASSDNNAGEKPRYYNVPKTVGPQGEGQTYYNKSAKQGKSLNFDSGGLKVVKHYPKAVMGQQVPSKLWAYMAPAAKQAREDDIELALQRQYEIRQKNINAMKRRDAEAQELYLERERKYYSFYDEHRAELEQRKAEFEEKKRKAYKAMLANEGKGGYTTKNVRPSERSTSTGLKKPKRLYNDPNR